MGFDLVLTNGRVIDPSQKLDRVTDVAFTNGKVAQIGDKLETDGAIVKDVAGRIVTPGLIDLHTHVYWGGTSLGIDAEEYARRLMFLGGNPVMKPAKTPKQAKSLKAMFEADLADEKDAIAFYTKAARAASDEADIGTRNLFEQTALDEEGHMAWLDLQLSLLDRMGEPAYIAIQISGSGGE